MAPRAYWKGFLRLSLVSCPIQLFPATSEREKVSFNQINSETGNRIRYRKVDEDTGEEVTQDQIVKGYQVDKGQYIEITDEELEAIAIDTTRTIEIDEFVPRSEIDDLYLIRPYYIAPDGKVGQDAFVVIRNVIKQMNMVAIGRVVLTSREHVIALEPRGKGLMGTLLRYPYEVRDENEYFDDIEAALKELIEKKSKGIKIEVPASREPTKVINLMDALRRSVKSEQQQPARKQQGKRGRKRIEGQKEMLFPISGAGKKPAKEAARKPARSAGRRKAG